MLQLAPDSRTGLRQTLVEYFGLDELDTLCYDLGVDPDIVPGRGRDKGTRVREIVTYFEDRGRLPDLIALCAKERPNVPWSDYLRFAPTPTAYKPPPPPATDSPPVLAEQSAGTGSAAPTVTAAGVTQSTAAPVTVAASIVAQSTAAPTLAPLLVSIPTATPAPPAALNVTNTAARSIKPALMVDGAGVLHLTWLDDTLRQGQPDLFQFDVLHRQRPPNGQWSDITNLTQGFRSVTEYHLELLRNPAGEPCVIWQGDASREDVHGFYMRCLTAGQWSPAQLVEELGRYGTEIVSVFAPDGRLVSIKSIPPNYTPFFGDVDLSDGLKYASGIQFAIDATGGYHLAWARHGDPISVEYRASTDGGVTWAPAVRLSTDETQPHGSWLQLAADATGAVHLVYGGENNNSLYRRWTPDGGWEATVDLGRFRLPSGIKDLVVDGAGLDHGVWWGRLGEIFYAQQQPDGAWAGQIIATSGLEPVLALDDQGTTHIAWEVKDDARDIYYATVP